MTPTPEECHKCQAPQRNYREHGYPYWQFYECGAKYSNDLDEWASGDSAGCLRRQLAASQERVRDLRSYVQNRGHAMTCPQATGPYDLDIYLEPSCTCGYDAALRGPETS